MDRYLRADMSKGKMVPIASTIDPVSEPDENRAWPPSVGQKLDIIDFGMPLTRLRTLRVHCRLMKLLKERELLGTLTLAGKSDSPGEILDETETLLNETRCSSLVTRAFDLPSDDLSRLFLRHHVGLIHNPYATLTKSTVFAAYCTHGLLTVVPPERGSPSGPYVVNDDSKPDVCAAALAGALALPTREERQRLLFKSASVEFAAICRP